MTWPLDTALVSLAQDQQVATQYAFQFTCAQIDGASWNYTKPRAVTVFGDVYEPKRIDLVDDKEGGDGTATTTKFKIKAEPLEPFLSLIGRGLPFIWSVKVFEVYFDDDGNPVPWLVAEGQLVECSMMVNDMELTFQPLSAWLDKKFPQPLFQTQDGRMPWDSLAFGLDPDSYAVAGTVNEVVQTILYSAAASGQVKDYYRMGFIAYDREIGGQTVRLRYPIITNVPSTDDAHPEYGFFVLAAPPYLLSENGDTFLIYPGYGGGQNQSIGKNLQNPSADLGVLPTYNFFTRVLQTIRQIAGASSEGGVTLNHAYPLYASHFTASTAPANCSLNAAAGTITFTATPAALNDVVELKWPGTGLHPNKGFRGFTEMAAWNPVTTSQSPAKPPPGPTNIPAIDHFENADHYPITGAAVGQTVRVVGSGFHAFGSGILIQVGGVTATETLWNDTTIDFVVPPGLTSGAKTVAITSSDSSGNLQNQTSDPKLTIVAANSITDYLDGNNDFITSQAFSLPVTIVGNGFGPASGTRRVTINGAVITSFSKWTANTIIVTVPNQTPYNTPAAVVVHSSHISGDITGPNFSVSGTLATNLIDHYENTDNKIITSGNQLQPIRIIGNGFGVSRGTGDVYFGDIKVGTITTWTNTLLILWLPSVSSPEVYPFTAAVTIRTGTGLTSTGPDFTIGATQFTPWIDHFEDVDGNRISAASPGDTVYIIGNWFGPSRSTCGFVSIGGTQLTSSSPNLYLAWSERSVKIKIPSAAAGPPATVIVHSNGGSEANSDDYTGNFTVIA